MFKLTPQKTGIFITIAMAVGYVLPIPGSGSAPVAVHALDVPAGQLSGLCADAPQLDVETLTAFFAPAANLGDPVPVAIVDPQTFTITFGDAGRESTYTVKLTTDSAPTATGPDAASAALLARHVGQCVGALLVTAEDGPAMWTDAGTFVPYASLAVDR